MMRKPVAGLVRNKEKSKQKLLDAVGKILRTKGFRGLKVNDIAATAGLDKKLIYNYFGSVDALIDAYMHGQDFWSNAIKEDTAADISDSGQEIMKQLFFSQFEYLYHNKELQKIILWELSEERASLKQLYNEREAKGELLLKYVTDPHFGENADCFRAICALLVAGIYYIDIHADVNFSTICGLDVNEEAGRAAIRKAISFIIDRTYADLPAQG